jgi:hypothetical protein
VGLSLGLPTVVNFDKDDIRLAFLKGPFEIRFFRVIKICVGVSGLSDEEEYLAILIILAADTLYRPQTVLLITLTPSIKRSISSFVE